ncbi:MAG TPA: LacI family DNA-binding transcriptional regulator [Ktedonobacteraceae bacterium]
MKQKLTIQDIAKFAGVSKATVSRVLNHKPTVDPAIRQRVLKVVKEKGFVPSMTVTVLRGERTPLIGVLAPPITWPIMPEIMLGIAEVTDPTSYEVQYTMSPTRNHREVLERLLGIRLSMGFLAIMTGKLGKFLDELYEQGMPIVTIDDQVVPGKTPWIGIDNVKSAYEATHHLLGLGHRRIGHILGRAGYLCTSQRYEGYCRALHEAGLKPDPALLWQGDFTSTGGSACAHAIFSLPPGKRPCAIFAANDQTALAVMEVAEQYKVRIPTDLAIVGFDDMAMAPCAKIGLTTIRQPHHEMGQLACELLLSTIDPKSFPFAHSNKTFLEIEKEGSKLMRFLLPTKLIIRESCGTLQSTSRLVP